MTFTRALPFQSTFPRGERRGPYLIFLSPCRFQSTFPRGERHLCWLVAVKHIHFNPRSLVGNDYIPVGTYTIVEISIHVPSWGTTIFTRRQPPCILFQSTFPRGERRKSEHKEEPEWQFQSTFPRGERRFANICRSYRRVISIHVPSWGTTETWNGVETFHHISIHVPSWGTTTAKRLSRRVNNISIHVPSWGTTKYPACSSPSAKSFQSTFPRGERLDTNKTALVCGPFQSTFPRGERRGCNVFLGKDRKFQSTFPRGERRQIFTNILCFFMQ